LSDVDAVVAAWREALAWRPDPSAMDAIRRRNPRWAGYIDRPFSLQPPPSSAEAPVLLAAYDDFALLNAAHFDGLCPPVKMVINPRLRSTGGRIHTTRRVLELNGYRLGELPETRVETIFHELVHLWLHAQGLPSGHTALFKQKMAERGHTSIHYGVAGDPKGMRHAYPGSDRRILYRCTNCEQQYERRVRYRRAMLCGRCLREGRGRHRIEVVGEIDGRSPR